MGSNVRVLNIQEVVDHDAVIEAMSDIVPFRRVHKVPYNVLTTDRRLSNGIVIWNCLAAASWKRHMARPDRESAVVLGNERGVLCAQCSDRVHPLIRVDQGGIEQRPIRYETWDVVAAVNAYICGYVEVDEDSDLLVLKVELLLRGQRNLGAIDR